MKIRFSIKTLLLVCAIIALVFSPLSGYRAFFVSPWITNLSLLITLQVAIVLFMADTLSRKLPTSLLEFSRANYMRIDGSVSARRRSKEHAARRKIRQDMMATMFGVAIVGNCLLGAVDTFVMPLGLMPRIAAAFNPNPQAWKKELRRRGLDNAAAKAVSSRGTRAGEEHLRVLWNGWPLLIIAAAGFVAAACGVLRFAYLRSLDEFRQGVASRADEYVQLDITRMTHHEEQMVPN